MQPAVGIDLVAVSRLEDALARGGQPLKDRLFTAAEQAYCETCTRPAQHYAARFAAKEAVMKVLGTGWGKHAGFAEVEVVRADSGALSLSLTGKAAETAGKGGLHSWCVSLSHTTEQATAVALALRP